MNDKPRFKNKETRNLMALALALDPTMRDSVRQLFRMGVRNIRHDHIVRTTPNGKVEWIPDPGAWSGDINPHVGIMLLRNKDGGWWLNGF